MTSTKTKSKKKKSTPAVLSGDLNKCFYRFFYKPKLNYFQEVKRIQEENYFYFLS